MTELQIKVTRITSILKFNSRKHIIPGRSINNKSNFGFGGSISKKEKIIGLKVVQSFFVYYY